MHHFRLKSIPVYLSILLSLVGITFIIIGQYKLGLAYQKADGKTQALFPLHPIGMDIIFTIQKTNKPT